MPLVCAPEGSGRAVAWTAAGRHALPDDTAAIVGPGHPFLNAATDDFIALVHHPDAGDLAICGWHREGRIVTLANENGSHAGPGP